GRLKFRMCGIQAPERFRPFYDDAGRMLKQLFGRKTIAVYVVDIDKYKRKVAVMFAAGEAVSINEKMVRYGGAKHYKRFSQNCAAYVSPARFVAAEKSAKKQKRGIWGK
ncbi:MAG: thermonuclease family protein, partial [Betaproteobacteria bacterium]|nr:thermonuclease family protein [Betaproteobacteria bacterium]